MSSRIKIHGDRIFGAFLAIVVVFIIRTSPVAPQGSFPLWGNKPEGKKCLDFCNLFNVCNNGKCFINRETCKTECFCEEGFTGRWCKSRIDEGKKEESDSNNKTQPRFILRGGGGGIIWKPRLRFPPRSNTSSKPRFIFKIEETIIGNKTPLNPVAITTTSVIPGDPNGPTSKSENISQISELSVKNNDTIPMQTTSTQQNLEQRQHPMSKLESTTPGSTSSQKDTATTKEVTVYFSTAQPPKTSPSITLAGTGQPLEEETNETDHSKNYYLNLESCVFSCRHGECSEIDGKYECIEFSDDPNTTALQDRKEECLIGGFVCRHGHCDQENFKRNLFKCVCDPGWVGDLCDISCKLDCGKYGLCYHKTPNKTEMGCLCDTRYTGDRCQSLRPKPAEKKESPWHWYVVGISIALVTVFVLTMVSLPYWLWKKRMMFVMRIVHYFQQYEEDDGKTFDAFISYKSSKEDEKFVLQKLYPKLELELGFKLCMHFRDFTPGEAIANNIIRAIEDSRRTIMILSTNYINSEWCRMEYQKAQHEMLKMRHKIIPIVLDDISTCKNLDRNLKTILSTVTYLEWPSDNESKKEDKFWKKLALSLPKKRNTTSDITSPHPVSSPPTSTSSSDVTSAPVSLSTSTGNTLQSGPHTVYNIQIGDPVDKSNETAGEHVHAKSSESHTGRLRKIMKDVLKLKINNNQPRPLIRECSTDSNFSTPLSDTPSPGFFSGKDFTPLLSRRVLKGGTMPTNSVMKSSTWSHRNKSRQSERSSVHHSHSLRERDSQKPGLDVIPQTPSTADSTGSYLPDVCRVSDIGYYNILCEEAVTPSSNIDTPFVLQNNITLPERNDVKESNISLNNDTVLNIAPTVSCPTCVVRKNEKNNLLNADDTSNLDENTRVIGSTADDKHCNTCLHRVHPNHLRNTDSVILNINHLVSQSPIQDDKVINPTYLNIDITGNSRVPSCETCVLNSNPTNADVVEPLRNQCPTCVLKCHVENEDPNQNIQSNITSGNNMKLNILNVNTGTCSNEDSALGLSTKTSSINMMNIGVLGNTSDDRINNNPVLNNLDCAHPIPPVRLKKLQRMNSKEGLA